MDRTIKQSGVNPIRVQLGELGYLTQGDEGFVLIERESALVLSDMLVAWALDHRLGCTNSNEPG